MIRNNPKTTATSTSFRKSNPLNQVHTGRPPPPQQSDMPVRDDQIPQLHPHAKTYDTLQTPSTAIPGALATSISTGSDAGKLDPNVGRTISHRYVVEQKIGSGKDLIAGLWVAIKIEPKLLKHPQLEYEAKVYQLLAGSRNPQNFDCTIFTDSYVANIPNYHYFVQEENDSTLIMDLLGPSLEDLFNYCGRRFSIKTVVNLADQMLQRIEYLHYKHFIHRDIKPDNFVVGLSEQSNKIFLIDFGLAKRYRRPGSLVHIPPRDKKNLTGTARYASINTHKGLEQSRRDDLESLGYVLIYFLRGQLPWQGLKAVNKNDKYGRIFEKKFMTPPEMLCEGLPGEFVQYFYLVRSLKFEERPDYDTLRKLFRAIQVRERFKRDGLYDWTLLKMYEKAQSAGNINELRDIERLMAAQHVAPLGHIAADPFAAIEHTRRKAVEQSDSFKPVVVQDAGKVGPSTSVVAKDNWSTVPEQAVAQSSYIQGAHESTQPLESKLSQSGLPLSTSNGGFGADEVK